MNCAAPAAVNGATDHLAPLAAPCRSAFRGWAETPLRKIPAFSAKARVAEHPRGAQSEITAGATFLLRPLPRASFWPVPSVVLAICRIKSCSPIACPLRRRRAAQACLRQRLRASRKIS